VIVHIPDGWIDLPTSVAGAAVAVGAVTVSARRTSVAFAEKVTTLPAVIAAYLLVAQLLVLPVGLGTSAHLVGTGLAALLVGPAIAIVCVAVVVVVQALLLADGGVTAIGLNIVNDGIVPALVAWGVFRLGRDRARTHRSVAALAGIAAGCATVAVGVAVSGVFTVGGTDAVPARVVASALTGSHLVLGVVEGLLTAAIVTAILRIRPDLVLAARLALAPGPGPAVAPSSPAPSTTAAPARTAAPPADPTTEST
jgi:cobalt/nickel transport system permease protein